VINSFFILRAQDSNQRNKHYFVLTQKRPRSYFRAKNKNRVQLPRTRFEWCIIEQSKSINYVGGFEVLNLKMVQLGLGVMCVLCFWSLFTI
jgi:hypothetical protein